MSTAPARLPTSRGRSTDQTRIKQEASTMKPVKRAGGSAWRQRPRTMHGSTAEWGMAKSVGKERRLGEKPVIDKWFRRGR